MNAASIITLPRIRECLREHQPMRFDSPEVTRRAAVAAILLERSTGLEVLLMRRADKIGDPWSGHISFPGGKVEPHDVDLAATAARETHEEMGIDLAVHGELLGQLDDVPAFARSMPTGMVVTPYVFALRTEPALLLNHEVVEAVWAPLFPMFDGALDETRTLNIRGTSMQFSGYRVHDHWVWGLTFVMIQKLFGVIDPAFQRWTGPETL